VGDGEFGGLSEAQAHLAELLDGVERGEEIVIEREGRAVAKVVAVAQKMPSKEPRVGGQNLLGVTYISPNFDDPMSEEERNGWGY
jgi:prevent-host-death family protein